MGLISDTLSNLSGRVFSHGTKIHYGDFRDDLLRDGYAVIKGAVPRDRALKYVDEIYEWLEELCATP